MKRAIACAAIFAACLARAQTDRPLARSDRNSQIAHAQLVEKARKGGIDIYFEGDSITRRWGTSDAQYHDFLSNWMRNFCGWNAADFGWGADRIQNVLWRLDNGELDGVNPKIIVLMIGTNNLYDDEGSTSADIARGLHAILRLLQQKAPSATIILMGITPRNDRGTSIVAAIDRINESLSEFADGKKIRYLNMNDKLADANGKLFEGMTVDGLHLSVKGYQVWADALKPIITEIVGPPTKMDHAPPPTGDPSRAGIECICQSARSYADVQITASPSDEGGTLTSTTGSHDSFHGTTI